MDGMASLKQRDCDFSRREKNMFTVVSTSSSTSEKRHDFRGSQVEDDGAKKGNLLLPPARSDCLYEKAGLRRHFCRKRKVAASSPHDRSEFLLLPPPQKAPSKQPFFEPATMRRGGDGSSFHLSSPFLHFYNQRPKGVISPYEENRK